VQTSPLKPSRQGQDQPSQAPGDHDVVRIPEAGRGGLSATAIAIGAAVVVALLVGAVLGYAWERRAVSDREDQIAAALVAAKRAQDVADGAAAQVGVLGPQVAALQNDLRQARQAAMVLRASRQELRRTLAEARHQQAAMADQLGAARAQARHLSGTQLTDGGYVGMISAVAASQTPPRVVFDPGAWFNGRSARAAAVKDGVIRPNEPWSHKHYFRDREVQWRTLHLAPDARVILWNLGGQPRRQVVGIDQLQRAFTSRTSWGEQIRHDPFRVVISDGRVIAVTQLRYP
jgi:hypothetical protein